MTTYSTETNTIQRTCADCGQEYMHEPMIVGGLDLLGRVKICQPCSDQAEQEDDRIKREEKARAAWEASVPVGYRKTEIDHPDFPKKLHEQCKLWLIDRSENRKLCLGLVGESGRGKSRVISQLAKRIIWRGEDLHWVNSAQFQWAAQHQFSDADGRAAAGWLRSYRKARVLVFDDIGSLKGTEAVSEALYSLLEYRTTREMPILWSSNETIGEMLPGSKITDLARKRVLSRLGGFSNIIEL